MPGLVAFRRRWSVGSDDLVVPGVFLFGMHFIWVVVLTVTLTTYPDPVPECGTLLFQHLIGYLAIFLVSLLLELFLTLTALRGSILDVEKRKVITHLIYLRLGMLFVEVVWLALGIVWLSWYYTSCTQINSAKDTLLGIVICSLLVTLSVVVTLWCTFDPAGRSWVKMMNYQRSMKQSESRFQYRRSGSCTRTWRQRKVLRAYQDSWDHRCRLLFCCMRHSDRSQNSFADIARLLSDFFRDIDVVPSDVVAGLILLRKYQKVEREAILKRGVNDTYAYLSGVAVTSKTQFLPLHDPAHYNFFQDVIYYMHLAMGAYGWPFYVMNNSVATLCELCASLRCSCFGRCRSDPSAVIIKDNCCMCNHSALQQIVADHHVELVYANFHVDVAITPFFVAVDYQREKIIISVRGTLSLKDILTDLNAEGETIPIKEEKEDWLGHKGMVLAAVHIRDKLLADKILERAWSWNVARGTHQFKLVTVGHSLGAGTAAILAILLRDVYPDVVCYAYSPPGGCLSLPVAEYTKAFITSVVLGKDVVPRIGLHQMESLRADLMHAIRRSKDPKWKTISCSIVCCGCAVLPTSAAELKADDAMQNEYQAEKQKAREVFRAQNSNVALTSHQPLFPPGRIIHVVRHHTTKDEQMMRKRTPVYQALWANNTDFDEVLISPVMIQDHMPDQVLAALEKALEEYEEPEVGVNCFVVSDEFRQRFLSCTQLPNNNMLHVHANHQAEDLTDEVITSLGPRKPQRRSLGSRGEVPELTSPTTPPTPVSPPHKLLLETSFTNLASLTSPDTNHNLKMSLQSFNSHSSNSNSITLRTDSLKKPEVTSPRSLVPWEYQSVLEPPPRQEIHDDWFGLAPLATPESLSEVSSISSRASSLIIHCEKSKPRICKQIESIVIASPRGLRRTLKISNGLAKAGEDENSNARFRAIVRASPDKPEDTESYASEYSEVYASAKSSNTVTPRKNLEQAATVEVYASARSSSGDSSTVTPSRAPPEDSQELFASAKNSVESFTLRHSTTDIQDLYSIAKSSSGELFSTPNHPTNINYHKPTMVILPTDDNYPKSRDTPSPYPYLETDFSLSDPALNVIDHDQKTRLRPERLQQGISFDQDYEFDIETDRLINSQNESENSLLVCKSLQTQDSCYRDEDSLEEGLKKKEDVSRVHFASHSAESLPLLSAFGSEKTPSKRKYSFSILSIAEGESSV